MSLGPSFNPFRNDREQTEATAVVRAMTWVTENMAFRMHGPRFQAPHLSMIPPTDPKYAQLTELYARQEQIDAQVLELRNCYADSVKNGFLCAIPPVGGFAYLAIKRSPFHKFGKFRKFVICATFAALYVSSGTFIADQFATRCNKDFLTKPTAYHPFSVQARAIIRHDCPDHPFLTGFEHEKELYDPTWIPKTVKKLITETY